jgi:hypothetical protein
MKKDQTKISAEELLRAKEATAALLQTLGLEAYLFEVELRGGEWEIKLECAVEGGWQSLNLAAPRDELIRSLGDGQLRQELAKAWAGKLACLR